MQFIFKNLNIFLKKSIAFFLCLTLLYGCKKADHFYEKLDGLLQVDVSASLAYRTSYVVGDTLQIYGLLKADQNLQVLINGVNGEIIKREKSFYFTSERDSAYMDHISVLISEAMIGTNLPVAFKNGDLSGTGPSIDVLSYYGEGSFDKELTNELLYTFPDRENIFLYCASGKGDVYYYSQTDKRIRHLHKDGTEDAILDLSLSLPDGSITQEFLAGGVDPGNQNLYFSVHTDKGYALYKLALTNQNLTLLNASQAIAQPFSGKLDEVNIVVTSIYPDKNGNLYLGIGNSAFNVGRIKVPAALAYYTVSDKAFGYLYKWYGMVSGSPGEQLQYSTTLQGWRLNPDDKMLYVFDHSIGIDAYDLESRVKRQTVKPSVGVNGDIFQFVANFQNTSINFGGGANPDLCFGLMPMPGNRLQALLYQYYNSNGTNIAGAHDFPKWMIFDFKNARTYAYAKGRFDRGSYVFNPTTYLFPKNIYVDELLNWDEDGQLYMSANGKKVLLRTKIR